MLKNYIITALRVLLRNKLYSLINIGGLAIGLTVVILIGLFVYDEMSYDAWLSDSEQIFRIETVNHFPSRPDELSATSSGPVLPIMLNDYSSDIESGTRLVTEDYTINDGDASFRVTVRMVDPTFFDVFDLDVVTGDRNLFSQDNNSIVITQATAVRLFGDASSAIGQIMPLANGTLPMKVVAVIKNIPDHSHLDIEAVALFDPSRYIEQPWINQMWFSPNIYTYLRIKDPVAVERIENDLPSFLNRHAGADRNNRNYEKPSENITMSLMPVRDIHLYSKGRFQMKTVGDIMVVQGFSAIALLILFIASINFTNLATARASLRASEIALRKTVGASRSQIVIQFLGEAVTTVIIALIVALSLVELALPWFSALIAKVLDNGAMADPIVQMGLFGLVAVVALGAGAHPAFRLSSYRPGLVLQGSKLGRGKSSRLQFALVTLQFTISIGLIISTIIVYSQINYAKNAGNTVLTDSKLAIVGFGNQQLLAGPVRDRLENLAGVKSTSLSGRLLPLPNFWNSQVRLPGQQGDTGISLEALPGHFDTLNFFGAELVTGRFFDAEFRGDLVTSEEGSLNSERSGIINETAVARMGYVDAEDAIGKVFHFKNFEDEGYAEITIVGVVRDMNFRSARDPITPMVYLVQEEELNFLNVELAGKNQAETLSKIDEIWKNVVPSSPIRRTFLDERFSRLYDADQKRGEFFAYFSFFAMFVSLLGLFGLSALAVERRSREIGVRKVLGASVLDIVKLLTLQFSKPALIANIIAWPLVAFAMHNWLTGFAYRIELNPLVFVGTGFLVLLFSWLTVGLQAFQGARANPIKTLRHG